eukprot:1861412-Rhodomonas_salina.1
MVDDDRVDPTRIDVEQQQVDASEVGIEDPESVERMRTRAKARQMYQPPALLDPIPEVEGGREDDAHPPPQHNNPPVIDRGDEADQSVYFDEDMASFAMRGYYHGQDYAQHIGKRYNVDPNKFDSITQAMLTAD